MNASTEYCQRSKFKISPVKYILIVLSLIVQPVYLDSPPTIEPNIKGLIAAFGDFDGDKLTDVFVIRDDHSFAILGGYKDEPLLRSRDDFVCKLPKESNEKIVALMTADFHGDAKLDVLVVTQDSSSSTHSLYLVPNKNNKLNCKGLENPINRTESQPLVFDFNGDMIADLFAISSVTSRRSVWTFSKNGTATETTPMFEKDKDLFRRPAYSHAFVDLNHDTIADVFIDGEKDMEYWNLGPNGYSSDQLVIIPRPNLDDYKVVGQSSFIDYDSDGIVDHLLPVCIDKWCINSAILLWNSSETKWTRIAENFRSPDNSTEAKFLPSIEISRTFKLPLMLRHADFNGDGFPDFITIVDINGKATVALLLNQPSPILNDRRTFSLAKVYEFGDHQPLVVSFFDLKEDGKPDIIVTTKDSNENWFIEVQPNELMFDACFIKIMVASGLNSESKHGTNQPGPHVCHEMVDTDGWNRRGCQGQLTQSTFLPLQMPYTIFGLGSTPNLVDRLSATIPSPNNSFIRSREWPQIVPDAQILVIPNPLDSTYQWRMKLFLTPSDMVLSTLITLASICIVLVILIGILHRKEILEDIAEHEEYKRHVPR